jgi:integrase
LALKPSSTKNYLGTLRGVLDFAGIDPNPARDSRVRLPRVERTVVDPPTGDEVETIIATVPSRWRLPLRTLEQTGVRVGELHALEWGDVDETGSRFRVKAGKTAAARRWVQVPE